MQELSPINHRSSSIAAHGACYGLNFGDVLIQRLLAQALTQRLHQPVWHPLGSSVFREALNQKRYPFTSIRYAVFGPGGYFGERPFSKAKWHLRLNSYHRAFHLLARGLRVPTLVFGVGVGPLSFAVSRRLVSAIMDRAQLVFVRDVESAEWVESVSCTHVRPEVIPDIAFLNLKNSTADDTSVMLAHPTIGVHLQAITPTALNGITAVAEDLNKLMNSNPRLRLVLFADDPVTELPAPVTALQKFGARVTYIPYTTPDSLIRLLESLTAVLTSKLHVGIASMSLGVPSFSVFAHDKVSRLYRQLNISERAVSLNRYPSGWAIDAISSAIQGTEPAPLEGVLAARRLVESALDRAALAVSERL